MELQEIESLKISYHHSCSNTSNDSIKQYRDKISKEKANQFLNLSIENDLNPEIVVSALLECCNSNQNSLISNIFLSSTRLILKNQFKSSESATKFVDMLKSKIPEYADLKFCS
jgi:translation elongation factor EF-4